MEMVLALCARFRKVKGNFPLARASAMSEYQKKLFLDEILIVFS